MPATAPAPRQQSRRYLRKQHVAERYGVNVRSVDRMKDDKRIPPPKYLPGSRIPIWAEDELDASDRRATLAPQQLSATTAAFARLLEEVSAAATVKKAQELVAAASLAGDLRAMSDTQLAALRDAIAEKPSGPRRASRT
jgi:predicted DNA-binding transcriptional regulator AlpA